MVSELKEARRGGKLAFELVSLGLKEQRNLSGLYWKQQGCIPWLKSRVASLKNEFLIQFNLRKNEPGRRTSKKMKL